jgi:tetratricopeptide (TPR) repeat protein
MTLNFTIISPKDIYQCSDFRLRYSSPPGDYTDEEAQKIIVVGAFEWTALVQFTGVAKTTSGFDTTVWLANLAARVKPKAPVSWVNSELLEVGRKYIGFHKHCFTVAGFLGSKPFVFIVSNFQGLPDTRISFGPPRWTISSSSQKHLTFATGSVEYLRPEDLRDLGSFARRYPPAVVQAKLAAANKIVAARAADCVGSESPISYSCFTGHLRNDGAGELIPHDVNPGGEFMPEFAVRMLSRASPNMSMKAKVDADGRPLPRRLVQIALKRGTTTGRPMPVFMFFAEFSNIEEIIGPPKDAEEPTRDLTLAADGFHRVADYAQARPLYERVLAMREKARGPEHPDTATSLNNLAAVLQDQGDLAGARPLFERALAIREKVLGPEHPDTAASLNNLAGLLRAQGDLADARPLYERALAIREKVFGPEHPDTAMSLNNLAFRFKAKATSSARGGYIGAP